MAKEPFKKPYLSLGEAIQSFLDRHGLKEEASVQAVIGEWEQLMGSAVSQNTEKIWFNKGILYVKITSPIWKSELQMARLKIKDMINERIGESIIREVRII